MTHRFEKMAHYGPARDWEEESKLKNAEQDLNTGETRVIAEAESLANKIPIGRIPPQEYVEQFKEHSGEDESEQDIMDGFQHLEALPQVERIIPRSKAEPKWTSRMINEYRARFGTRGGKHMESQAEISKDLSIQNARRLKENPPLSEIKEKKLPQDMADRDVAAD